MKFNDTYELDAIISMKDSRKDVKMLAKDHRGFRWEEDGTIEYRDDDDDESWELANIQVNKQWDRWNNQWFTENTVLGNKPENN